MSIRRVTRSSQLADSNWPESNVEEKDINAEEDNDDEPIQDEEAQEQTLAMTGEEDKVDMTDILLTMQDMQKKIDLLMKKHSLTEEQEAAVVPS